jgi:hypothetical protein
VGGDALATLKALFAAAHELIYSFNHHLATRFGTAFQLAVDWVLLGLALVVTLRLFRFLFDVLRFVLLPSVLVSGLVAAVSPLTFMYVMPLAMGVGTLVLLFKS